MGIKKRGFLRSNFCDAVICKLLFVSVALIICVLSGCSGTSSSIIAATGTTIGVELSQNQATQTPTAVLGYRRAELAYVPTNRASVTKTTTQGQNENKNIVEEGGTPSVGNGARDSANVLMELRYRGIFAWGQDSGIYQRLAVGDIAVGEPGASYMFSKNEKGNVDPEVAKYVAYAQVEIANENRQIEKIVEYVTDGSDAINADTLGALVSEAASTNENIFTATVSSAIKSKTKGNDLKSLLFDSLDTAIYPLYKSLPTDKQ